jgi:hypothetical protein
MNLMVDSAARVVDQLNAACDELDKQADPSHQNGKKTSQKQCENLQILFRWRIIVPCVQVAGIG